MAEITMKNQPSKPHWWWLDEHTSARRSPWLQSTLTELNEKTKAMLKLIEEDADSFAQRAEMFYKKRPELVSMVEDFYKIHRLLAERYDQVRPEAGVRLLPPSACLKYSQSEKWTSFDYRCYDSYSENCDVEESVESEIDDPEQEGEVRSVAPNEVMKLLKDVERVGEVKKTDKDQIKQKDDVLDEVMMLREEVDRLGKENEAHKNELAQKNTIYNEVVTNLKEEIEQLKKDNKTKKDEVHQKNIIREEVMKLREEIERLRKENEAQKKELKKYNKTMKDEVHQKYTICGEVIKLKEEIEQLKKENEAQKKELKKNDSNSNEVMELRKELERHKKENESQKEELKKNDSIHNEVMKLRKELERHKEEKKAQNDELEHKDTIHDEITMLKEERESFREENRTHKDDLKRKDKEKIEVIRQLSSTIDLLKQDNIEMKNFIAKESAKKWKTSFEFDKLIETFSGKLFKGGPRRNKPSVVAL